MAEASSSQASSSREEDGETFDMNNNDPNNNTDFQEGDVVILDNNADDTEGNLEDIQLKLLQEARNIHAILNRYSVNEIYSYLEANIDHPERAQFVMNRFLIDGDEDDIQIEEVILRNNKESNSKRVTESNPMSDDIPAKKSKVDIPVEEEEENFNLYDSFIDLTSSDDDNNEDSHDNNEPVPVNPRPIVPPVISANTTNTTTTTVVANTSTKNTTTTTVTTTNTNATTVKKEDNLVETQIKTLQDMFPNINKITLRNRYMELYPSQGADSLNLVASEMLDDYPAIAGIMQHGNPTQEEQKTTPLTPSPEPAIPKITIKKISPKEFRIKNPIVAYQPKNTSKEPIAGPSNATVTVPNAELPDKQVPGPSTSASDTLEQEEVALDIDAECLAHLTDILPDADPTYLRDKCVQYKDNKPGLINFITQAVETKDYPTLEEYLKREAENNEYQKFTGRISVKELSEMYPDAEKHFSETVNTQSDYLTRCMHYLLSRFRNVSKNSINLALRKHENLTKAYKDLNQGVGVQYIRSARGRVTDLDPALKSKKNLSFLQELTFIERKGEIEQYRKKLEEEKKAKFELAKAKGELLTCGCCFDDECLITDMSACPEGHLFCKQCIKRFVGVEIGDGKTKFTCLQESCEVEFSLDLIQEVLDPKTFSKLLSKRQFEEVASANIPDLETCPHCTYCTILPPEEKVFKCMNEDCKKQTCRLCKEPSHIPLRCDEVEKDEEVQARTYIESKMTEALLRECWKCHKKFIKSDGCNKMRCNCGAIMCYLCRKQITGYDHFYNHQPPMLGRCPLYSNNDELHVRAIEEEAKKALEDLKKKDPNVKLKHDPTKILPEAQAHGNRLRPPNLYVMDWTNINLNAPYVNVQVMIDDINRRMRMQQDEGPRQANLEEQIIAHIHRVPTPPARQQVAAINAERRRVAVDRRRADYQRLREPAALEAPREPARGRGERHVLTANDMYEREFLVAAGLIDPQLYQPPNVQNFAPAAANVPPYQPIILPQYNIRPPVPPRPVLPNPAVPLIGAHQPNPPVVDARRHGHHLHFPQFE